MFEDQTFITVLGKSPASGALSSPAGAFPLRAKGLGTQLVREYPGCHLEQQELVNP